MPTRTISGVPESITKDLKLKGFKIHALAGSADLSVHRGRRDLCMSFYRSFYCKQRADRDLANSPLFRSDGMPVIQLNKEQAAFMTGLFQKMLSVHSSDYYHKDNYWKGNSLSITRHSHSV